MRLLDEYEGVLGITILMILASTTVISLVEHPTETEKKVNIIMCCSLLTKCHGEGIILMIGKLLLNITFAVLSKCICS